MDVANIVTQLRSVWREIEKNVGKSSDEVSITETKNS